MINLSWRTLALSVVINLAYGVAMRFLPGAWWVVALGFMGGIWVVNVVVIRRAKRLRASAAVLPTEPPPATPQSVDPLAPGYVPPTLSQRARERLCRARASGKAAQRALAAMGCPLFFDTPDFTEGRADGAADWDRDLGPDTAAEPTVPAAPRSLTYLVAWFMGYVARGVNHGATPTADARPN